MRESNDASDPPFLAYFASEEPRSPRSWRLLQLTVALLSAVLAVLPWSHDFRPAFVVYFFVKSLLLGSSGTSVDLGTVFMPFAMSIGILAWRARLWASPRGTRVEHLAVASLAVVSALALAGFFYSLLPRTLDGKFSFRETAAIWAGLAWLVFGIVGIGVICWMRIVNVFPYVMLQQVSVVAAGTTLFIVSIDDRTTSSITRVMTVMACVAIAIEHAILIFLRGPRTP